MHRRKIIFDAVLQIIQIKTRIAPMDLLPLSGDVRSVAQPHLQAPTQQACPFRGEVFGISGPEGENEPRACPLDPFSGQIVDVGPALQVGKGAIPDD